jgi:hypothetical protein
MALNSFIDGRWVGPEEAARLSAQKASQAAYKIKWQEALNKQVEAKKLAGQKQQADYFSNMASALSPMFQTQIQTTENIGNMPIKNNTKVPPQDIPSTPGTTALFPTTQAPQIPTPPSTKLLGDYTDDEIKVLKKLLETYRKNPNSFANLI